MKRKIIIITIILAAILVVLYYATQSSEVSVYDLKVGDKVAGMKVIDVGPFNEDLDFPLDQNARVKFEGMKEIKGNMYVQDAPGGICFEVDTSRQKLPVLKEENNPKHSFCFRNEESLYNTDFSSRWILIDNYEIIIYPSMGSNLADYMGDWSP